MWRKIRTNSPGEKVTVVKNVRSGLEVAAPNLTFRTKKSFSSPIVAMDVGDVDMDGEQEIIIGTYNGTLAVIKLQGQELEEVTSIKTPAPLSALRVGDLDGNGTLEILAGLRDKQLRIYNFMMPARLEQTASYRFHDQIHEITFGDVFSKNLNHLVVCTGKFIYVFTYYRGELKEEGQLRQKGEIYSLAIADFDDTGNYVLLGGRGNEVQLVSYSSRFFEDLKATIRTDYYATDLHVIQMDGNRYVLVTTADGKFGIYLYAEKIFQQIYLSQFKGTINSVAYSTMFAPEKFVIILGGSSKELRSFDFKDNAMEERGNYPMDATITAIEVANIDGNGPKEVLIGLDNGDLLIYDLED